MKVQLSIAGSMAVASLLVGCGSGNGSTAAASAEGGAGDAGTIASPLPIDVDAECPVIVSESACDRTQRPIVFVHGTYSSGDNVMNVALLFGSNGYCSDRFVSIDYNSLLAIPGLGAATPNAATPAIDAAIDAVLKATGFSQVDLIGHSQGAMQIYQYLMDPTHAAKVAHYVQLAGGPQPAPPGPADAGIPTLSISSQSDVILGEGGVTGAEKTIVFQTQDHQSVCTSTDTFVAIWQYLHQGPDGGPDGQMPKYTTVQCGDPTITLSGLSETLGDNAPPPDGSKLEVYEMGSDPRDSGAPVQVFGSDAGAVTWQAKRLQYYEFRGIDATGAVIGHQYFTPFKRDNRWLRFVVPSQNLLAQIATNPVTTLNDDKETTFVVRGMKGAFRHDLGDTLTVSGYDALNGQDAIAQTATAALFIYDANKDGKTQGGVVAPGPPGVPYFLRGTDVFVASSPPAFVELKLNGTPFVLPNWPSKSQGLTVVTFQ